MGFRHRHSRCSLEAAQTMTSRQAPVLWTRRLSLAVALMIAGSGLGTAQEIAVPLADRARGAELVVVGQVTSSQAMWRVNEHGDRLIVSVLRVTREETLKGSPAQTLEVEVEGGTIGDLTLRVSDLPVFVPGDRAVFYVRRNAQKRLVPYLRGQGLLKLDRSNRVPASSLSLDEIRRTVGRAGR